MSTTRAITRIITVLFLLAGLLLLRKPVFGQTIIAAPTHQFDAPNGTINRVLNYPLHIESASEQ
jgi:hypothetical protein